MNNNELKPFKKNGKMYVTLENKEGRENCLVAELVAKTFLPNPNNYKFVKHKDGDFENCAANNLYWSDTE